MEIYVQKNLNGSLLLSAIVDGFRVHQQYFSYTKREALKEFRQYVKSLYPRRK